MQNQNFSFCPLVFQFHIRYNNLDYCLRNMPKVFRFNKFLKDNKYLRYL
jgi:hypothetical protein